MLYTVIAKMSRSPPAETKSRPQVTANVDVLVRVTARLALFREGQERAIVPVVGTVTRAVAVSEADEDEDEDEAAVPEVVEALSAVMVVVIVIVALEDDLFEFLALFTAIVPPTPPPIPAARMTSINARTRKNVVVLSPHIVFSFTSVWL